jgi:hypothetical protein
MIGLTLAEFTETKWEDHKKKYKRNYKTEAEHAMRKKLFQACLEEVEAENLKGNTYTVECREFADKTEEEKKSLFGLIPVKTQTRTVRGAATATTASTTTTTLPPAPPSVGKLFFSQMFTFLFHILLILKRSAKIIKNNEFYSNYKIKNQNKM